MMEVFVVLTVLAAAFTGFLYGRWSMEGEVAKWRGAYQALLKSNN